LKEKYFSIQWKDNPAARVGHYTWTISTSTQNASIWSLAAASTTASVFCALCTNWVNYLFYDVISKPDSL